MVKHISAVEWLLQHVCLNKTAQANGLNWEAVSDIATAMEKEQIVVAHLKGYMECFNEDVEKDAIEHSIEYYNKNYKLK